MNRRWQHVHVYHGMWRFGSPFGGRRGFSFMSVSGQRKGCLVPEYTYTHNVPAIAVLLAVFEFSL